jgi:hypothetical protein
VLKRSNRKMEKTVDWVEEISVIAGPLGNKGNRESWLAEAAKKAGVTLRSIKSLFYGEARHPSYENAEKIKQAAEKARQEALALAQQYADMAGALYAKDQDFFVDDIVALVHAARALRGLAVPKKEG